MTFIFNAILEHEFILTACCAFAMLIGLKINTNNFIGALVSGIGYSMLFITTLINGLVKGF